MAVRDQSTPYDGGVDSTPLQDAILGLLEEADIDTATNDAIIKLVEAAERRKYAAAHPESVDEGPIDDDPAPRI